MKVYLVKMLPFKCWILFTLLLGHLIAGVNREISKSSNITSYLGGVSTEASKIVHFHQKTLHADEFDVDNIFFRGPQFLNSSSRTLCSPIDSCVNRCGDVPKLLPFTCNCDPLCTIFTDCCIDYNEQCVRENSASIIHEKPLSVSKTRCEMLFMQYNVLTVSSCSVGYGDAFNVKMCSSEIPKECTFSGNSDLSDSKQVYMKCKQSVYKKCMSNLRLSCDVKVEPLCKFAENKCDQHATKICLKCKSSFWPVIGEDQVIYKNSYCALCNSQKSETILSPRLLAAKIEGINKLNGTDKPSAFFSRHCVPVDIDTCPKKNTDQEMQKLCHNHTAVVTASGGKKRISYKNAYCAMCNGQELKDLRCATKESLISRFIRPLMGLVTGDVQGIIIDDIPAAFSILLNFGLDGRERMYFSSEREEEMKKYQAQCGSGKIWDPFSEVCRKLYCSTEFILVDYRCVKKENPVVEEHENETSLIPDSLSEFVHLTLSLEMEMLDFLQFLGQEDIETICETLRGSLSRSFNINEERLQNVRFNISVGEFSGFQEMLRFINEEMDEDHPITFTVDFDLYEDSSVIITVPEPSVDSIVSMLASSLSMNGFELDINNATSRIFEIHQSVSPLTSWCKPEDGGEKREYWNSEFSLQLNEDSHTMRQGKIKGIYVNKTGRFYSQGEFIADILFQGYQFSGSLINVSGVAIVCDWSPQKEKLKDKLKEKLNESCARILIDSEEYSFLENGTLFFRNENLRNLANDSYYEKAENNSLWVCIKSLKAPGSSRMYNVKIDEVEAYVSYVLLWISVIAMAAVLITYTAFGSLRNLPGCNTMNLTFALMAMQLTFLFGQRPTVTGTSCSVVGHLLHYEILCGFMWMNVMAFDLFRTFGNRNMLSNIRSKRKFLPRYMVYAYFSPTIIIIIASVLDYLASDSPFAPNYGRSNVCWIVNEHSAAIFFAGPLAVIMCINFILFLLTVFAVRSVKNFSQLKDIQSSTTNPKSDVFLYAKMAIVIGLTWILSFSAASVRQSSIVGRILTYLFIIFNTLQGLFIFWVFVCNKKVYELYREAFRYLYRKISKQAKCESSSGTISKYSDAMKRTLSANTIAKTLSNASTLSNVSQISVITE